MPASPWAAWGPNRGGLRKPKPSLPVSLRMPRTFAARRKLRYAGLGRRARTDSRLNWQSVVWHMLCKPPRKPDATEGGNYAGSAKFHDCFDHRPRQGPRGWSAQGEWTGAVHLGFSFSGNVVCRAGG